MACAGANPGAPSGGRGAAAALVGSGLLWAAGPAARADPVRGGLTPAAKLTDHASWHRYPGSRPDSDNPNVTHQSQNPGRIWTDKTVFGDDEAAEEAGVDHDLDIADDEMAVVLSALGTTRQVRSTREPVIDLVIAIDNSNSMTLCVGTSSTCSSTGSGATSYRNSRAYAMVEGVNAAIQHIVEADPDARVSIVAFGTAATTVTPLTRPQTVTGTDDYLVFGPPNAQGRMTITTVGENLTVGYVGTSAQSTNIHRGIDRARSVLADQATSAVAGDEQHIPSVIVFSDGEPTLSANEAAWWNLQGTANHGPASPTATQYFGNGYLAALSGAYLKNQVTDVYNDEAYNTAHGFSPVETNVYTVGLGMSALQPQGQQLAYATLDPRGTLPAQGQVNPANAMATSFGSAMGTYATTGSTTVTVNSTAAFRVNRPSGQVSSGSASVNAVTYDPTYEQLRYNTTFDAPNTAEELVAVFERIANQVLTEEPVLPVETTTPDPNTDGYVTFTDPLGPFMRVSKMDSVVFCSILQQDGRTDCDPEEFTEHTTTTSGNTTTYVFDGSYAANDLFPETDLANIVVTVESNVSLAVGDIVTVKIPVALLPMINTSVLEDLDGAPRSMSWWSSHPVHLYYKVAPKPGVASALTDPTALPAADQAALAAYVGEHTVDGALRFYANAFDTADDGTRTSRAGVTFRPSTRNDFYRFARDSVLYTAQDPGATITPGEWDALPGTATVYRALPRYSTTGGQGDEPTKTLVYLPTTKANLLAGQTEGAQIRPVGGVMVAPAGLYNLSERVANLDIHKCAEENVVWVSDSLTCAVEDPAANRTQTDAFSREAAVEPDVAQSVRIRLGNNGWLEYASPGAFEVGKTVTTAQAGLAPDPDQEFAFRVTLTDPAGGPLAGELPYRVFDADGVAGRAGTVATGGTITLRDGEHARVMGLPDGAGYAVAEVAPPGAWTPVAPEVTDGTVAVPQATVPRLVWDNVYDVEPVTLTTVAATKAMSPSWLDGAYRVRLCPVGTAPVPADGDAESGCVTRTIDAEGQETDFGAVTFTRPGTFEYGLVELATDVPGVQDSLAQYRWTVEVTDTGTGQLRTTTALARVRDDAGGEAPGVVEPPATFTNTWSAGDLDRALEVVKHVRDASLAGPGQVRPPLIPYAFTFGAVDEEDPAEPPLEFADGGRTAQVRATPGSISVPSPPLRYTEDHVGGTYFYAAREDPFDPPVPGLTLSDAVWFFRIDVGSVASPDGPLVDPVVTTCETTADAVTEADPWGGCDPATGDYGPEGDGPVFVNAYDPEPADVALTATKTLDGRPWADGDAFTFDLAPADDVTRAAVEAGEIELPDPATATATAPADGAPNVTFGAITFHRQGVYGFTVTERAEPAVPGVEPDPRAVVYTVTVTDEPAGDRLDGQLEAAVSTARGEAELVNRFRARVPFANVVVTKTLTGREPVAGEFEVVVEAQDDASREKLGWDEARQVFATTADAPDGQPAPVVQLPQMELTQTDLGRAYTYVITEQESAAGGVTSDDTVHTVEVRARYDEVAREMWVETTVTSERGGTVVHDSRTGGVPEVGFANTYEAGPGTATIPVDKRIVGRDWRAGDTFTFRLSPATPGAPMPEETTVEVTADSATASPLIRSAELGPITFTEPGEYAYTIREVAPSSDPIEDIVYDTERVVNVTVRVTDDGSGTLRTEVVGPDGHMENIYRTPYHYEIRKRLDGRDSADGEFGVRVVPLDERSAEITDGQVPYPDGTVFAMPGAADGELALFEREARPVLTEDVLGYSYCYVYAEEIPDPPLPGITYDETRYQVCTTPSRREDGVLQATSVIRDADTGELLDEVVTAEDDVPRQFPQIAFRNTFNAWTLTKTSDPGSGSTVAPGSVVTYTLTATNTATTTLVGAAATDDLTGVLAHATLGDLPDGLVLDGTTLTWTVPDVAAGERATVSYRVTVADDAGGQALRNVVTGAGSAPPPAPCPDDDAACRATEHTVSDPGPEPSPPGEPTPTPTAPPEPPPSAEDPGDPGAAGPPAYPGAGDLPVTGFDAVWLGLLGLVLILVGGTLVAVRRRSAGRVA
nr:hypothetical protein GCM10025730_01190 [Promicromonospora thailandica]